MAQPSFLYTVAQLFYWDFRKMEEGSSRRMSDEKKYRELIDGLETRSFIDDEDRAHHQEIVDAEIRAGRLAGDLRESRLREIGDSENDAGRAHFYRIAALESISRKRIPGEPEVLASLLESNTPEEVRELCKDAYVVRQFEVEPGIFKQGEVRNWPIRVGSTLPRYLSQYAENFIAAKNDPRYPRSTRPTTNLKQFWFLSRALAGAVLGVKTRTALNLVGSMRPEQVFRESRNGKPARRHRKPKRKIMTRQN